MDVINPLNPIVNSGITVLKDITITPNGSPAHSTIIEFVFMINKVWTFLDGGTALPIAAPGNVFISYVGNVGLADDDGNFSQIHVFEDA